MTGQVIIKELRFLWSQFYVYNLI